MKHAVDMRSVWDLQKPKKKKNSPSLFLFTSPYDTPAYVS